MYSLRPALPEDTSALNVLIANSARILSRGFYNDEQIEAAIAHIYGVDNELVEDQSYYLIEQAGEPVACGGWSRRKTLFGGNQYAAREPGFLNPATDAAKIRAFFVHPNHARRGLGRMLLEYSESEAQRAGFTRIEMMATLPGIKLYEKFGYKPIDEIIYKEVGGVRIPGLRMFKLL